VVHDYCHSPERLRQEDQEFKSSLCCIARPCLKNTERKIRKEGRSTFQMFLFIQSAKCVIKPEKTIIEGTTTCKK
jgi:hypothetical protein